jgi:catechol 2,3-dioxygenase-like lactoylglutathione lyase family enzyme
MFDHIGTYVQDIAKAKEFYIAALKPLKYELISEYPEWSVIGLGLPAHDGSAAKADFWIAEREANHNVHLALVAADRSAVDAFHAAALAAGGTDNGAPGYRKEYSPGYYAAFIIDPFGNNLEAVFHDPAPEA